MEKNSLTFKKIKNLPPLIFSILRINVSGLQVLKQKWRPNRQLEAIL